MGYPTWSKKINRSFFMTYIKGSTVAATLTVAGLMTGAAKLSFMAVTAGITGTTLAVLGFAVGAVALAALTVWAVYLGVRLAKPQDSEDSIGSSACKFTFIFLLQPFVAISSLFKKCCCCGKKNID